jgi:hypothetical protein
VITRNLTIFACVVLSVGFFGRWLDIVAGTPGGQEGPGILIWLVVPSVTALLLRGFAGLFVALGIALNRYRVRGDSVTAPATRI